jgi:AraC family transcriptional regulator
MKRINEIMDYINRQIVKDWSEENGFAQALSIRTIVKESQEERKNKLKTRQFQQCFMRAVGDPVGAYVNRLRLERAAFLLRNTDKPVVDIAYIVGYTSENALFKQFKKQFDCTPKQYRDAPTALSPYPAAEPEMEIEPDPVVIILPQKHLIYLSHTGDYSLCSSIAFDQENWDYLYEYAGERRLLPPEPEYYGICFDDSTIRRPERCRFYACQTVSTPTKPDGKVGTMTIERGKYAVYTHVGSYDKLDAFYNAIFHTSPYELRDDFILERYLNSPQDTPPDALQTEVLIPIKGEKRHSR